MLQHYSQPWKLQRTQTHTLSQAMAAKNAEFEAAIHAADTPYMKDFLAKKQECECWVHASVL